MIVVNFFFLWKYQDNSAETSVLISVNGLTYDEGNYEFFKTQLISNTPCFWFSIMSVSETCCFFSKRIETNTDNFTELFTSFLVSRANDENTNIEVITHKKKKIHLFGHIFK